MVDVSHKPHEHRAATAEATILLATTTLLRIAENTMKKGDVLAVARIAGIQAAKQTSALIPLCHLLPLSQVAVSFETLNHGIRVEATAKTTAQTGVEMEALTAATVAALTIYDMCKAVDKGMVISDVKLLTKTKTPL
jgi:cyclic pyranopterin monophosphate synthase